MRLRGTIQRGGHIAVGRHPTGLLAGLLRGRVSLRSERGFSLMEAVLAMSLFAIVSTALLTVLVSSVSAQRLSRQKTISEQAAVAMVEYVRSLDYSQIGNPGGNPNGTVPYTQNISALLGSNPGLTGTITTKVEWNNNPTDKVATSYRNAAFFKKVTVTITRSSDGKQLSRMVTYVSDNKNTTGVSDAEIDLTAIDIGTNTPISGQDVTLSTGPSATPTPLTDTTDSTGEIVFPALTANPTSGATAYYNLTSTPPSGYTLLSDDDISQTPTSTNAHIQLAPSQIFPTTLRFYKGSQITVALQDLTTGSAYAGNATVSLATTLRGSAASQTYAYTGTPLSISQFQGENVIPSPSSLISGGYTASVSNGFYATAVTKATVPNAYPSDMTSTFTLSGYPTGSLQATVTWAGTAVSGATVTLTGGPTSVNQTATTNASGVATFNNLPAGSGYNLSAAKGGQTKTASATVIAGTTTNVPIAMPVGSVAVTVTSNGNPISGATITLTGGNITGTITSSPVTTDVNGQLTVTNVPAGTGITVTATKGAQSGSTSSVTVTGGATTNVPIAMPLGSIAVTVTWAGSAVNAASVTVSGGNLSSPVTLSTSAAGTVTFPNIPAGTGYTVTATKNGQTGTATSVTVTGGATTPVTVTMPVGSITVTVTWAGSATSGATVSLTGGNITGTITAGTTTNASGQVTISNVPVGTGITVTATKNGQTGTTTGEQVTASGPDTAAVAMPTGSVTVTVTWATTPVSGATVSLTGGNITGTITAGTTTNASGQVTITNVPVGTSVTATATKSSQTGTTSGQTVTAAGPNNIAVAMPVGTFVVSVDQPSGTNAANASVTLSGGPMSISVGPVTADAAGQVTFSNVPAGSGYTISATRYGQTGNATNQSVTGGGTSNVSINLTNYTQGSIKVTIKRSGGSTCNSTSFTWTISGGPYSIVQTGTATTNTSGVLGTFTGFPAGTGYTVNVVKTANSSHNATTSGVTVTNGGTASVTLTLNVNTCP